jgi:hypothetical protein
MTVKELRKLLDEWEKKGWITEENEVKVQDCYCDYVPAGVYVGEYTGDVLIYWK